MSNTVKPTPPPIPGKYNREKYTKIREKAAAKQKSLGAFVQRIRTSLRLDQDAFGILFGAHWTSVSRWENDHIRPSPMRLSLMRAMEGPKLSKDEAHLVKLKILMGKRSEVISRLIGRE